ncbi:hypothetical protein RvY_03445 [Ramazzottius varieornatus]|uniref:C-type lectin domain-containing protein n=1 Tax=Ramazzottius varieornatus TaxID=947166 RepID=A0A1D1URG4_RAMVA|nr:hypothetical protein RvY_03445 [Ramazzottius varieornatus]
MQTIFLPYLLFLLLIDLCLAGNDLIGPPYCPKTYIGESLRKNPKAARCYGFPLRNPKAVATWVDAEKGCKQQQGFLAILSDPKEADRLLKWIRQECLKRGITSIWVAANDAYKIAEFKWLDGAPLTPLGKMKYDQTYPTKHETPNW